VHYPRLAIRTSSRDGTPLLPAAFHSHVHWSDTCEATRATSPLHAWQMRISASDIPVEARFDGPVRPAIVTDLVKRFPEFAKFRPGCPSGT
jgi:hypothetical protein